MAVCSTSPTLTVAATVAVWAPGSCCSKVGVRNMSWYRDPEPEVPIGAQQASSCSTDVPVSESWLITRARKPSRGSSAVNPASSSGRLAASLAALLVPVGTSAAG